MNKLKLLLLEDLDNEANLLINTLEENNYKVVRVRNSEEAEKELKNGFFDIIILDIMIDGKPEGISLAKRINKEKIDVPFLFLTSMQSKALFEEAKFTNPFNYLLKPYNELELLYALELALETHFNQENSISFNNKTAILSPEFLFIKKNKSVVKVIVSSINYIEVQEKYCSLQCNEGSYLIKMSLKKVIELMMNNDFKQVHRNFLINIKKIKEIYFDDNLIIMDNSVKIPFSERYKAIFRRDNKIFN